MKVALVYPIPFGSGGIYGGGERYVLELARALSRSVETTLITVGSTRHAEQRPGLRLETYPWLTLLRGSRVNPLAFGVLRGVADADVVHCHTYSTLMTDVCVLFARLTGKRVFITDHGGGASLSLTRILDVAAYASGLLFVSEFSSRTFGRRRTASSVIYGGVDATRFSPPPARAQRTPKVLFVGRLLPHKGVDHLLAALPAEVPLTVVGRPYDPEYFSYLQRLAVDRRVEFVTDASDERVIAEYRSSTVAVLPSVYRPSRGPSTDVPELLGLSLLEAMACGTPVVATAVGGVPEIVQDGVTGFLVPPNDAPALGQRISRLIRDQALAQQMGSAAREHVLRSFTWEKVAERCLAAYRGGRVN